MTGNTSFKGIIIAGEGKLAYPILLTVQFSIRFFCLLSTYMAVVWDLKILAISWSLISFESKPENLTFKKIRIIRPLTGFNFYSFFCRSITMNITTYTLRMMDSSKYHPRV